MASEILVEPRCHEVEFVVGKRFQMYEDLANKIKEYEKQKCVQLWKRDSKTVQAALK